MNRTPFPYQLIRSRRKTATIQVKADGEVLVRVPMRMPAAAIERLLQEKAEWVGQARARMQTLDAMRSRASAEPGGTLWLLGRAYPIAAPEHPGDPLWDGHAFRLPGENEEDAAVHFFIRQAEAYLPGRVRFFAAQAGLPVPEITVGKARSRWGSCTADNRLRFSWRLLCTPAAAVDYVVAHELAHIRHHDHSPAFWHEVAAIWPDWRLGADTLRAFERAVDLRTL